MKLWLKALTPIHIGSGYEISPMEYFLGDGFSRLDLTALFSDPAFNLYRKDFLEKARRGQRYIRDAVPDESLLKKHVLYEIPISPGSRSYIASHPINVREHINSAGRIFIPGSSIKGAVISALLFNKIGNLIHKDQNLKSSINEMLKKAYSKNSQEKKSSNNFYEKIIGRLYGILSGKKPSKFIKWAKFGDSDLKDRREYLTIYYTKVVGTKTGRSIPIVIEGIRQGTIFSFRVSSDDQSFVHPLPKNWLKLIDNFYRLVWEKTWPALKVPDKGYLIRLGYGSSCWATSFLMLKEKYNLDGPLKSPRTKRLIEGNMPLGWALIFETQEAAKNFADLEPTALKDKSQKPVDTSKLFNNPRFKIRIKK